MKIYATEKVTGDAFAQMLSHSGIEAAVPGTILSDGKTYLAITTADGALSITELQLSGKKRMNVKKNKLTLPRNQKNKHARRRCVLGCLTG
jgi:methionyl-tRNA formyltransferase